MILTFCGCNLNLLILVYLYVLIIKKRTLKKSLRHPCDYKRYRIIQGVLQFTDRKSHIYLIINRIFTCYRLDIKTYKYGPCLNNTNRPKSGLTGALYIIYVRLIRLMGIKYQNGRLWGYSDTYDKWYNLCLFNIGNLEGVIKDLKWLEQGDKAHIKCFFIYNELVFLGWVWIVLLCQLIYIYLYKL